MAVLLTGMIAPHLAGVLQFVLKDGCFGTSVSAGDR